MNPTALPQVIRCATGCGATVANMSGYDDTDEEMVAYLRNYGWQVVNGEWTCPSDLPEDRRDLPGAMGRRRNPYCSNCGDTRGGAFGHETDECTWVATDSALVPLEAPSGGWPDCDCGHEGQDEMFHLGLCPVAVRWRERRKAARSV